MTNSALRPKKDNEYVRELERLINESDKTQTDIAEEIGYENHNMMTMFKRGVTRVPLEKVVPLAQAIGADPARMLNLWFAVYMPGALEIITRLTGKITLSQQEKSWVRGLRDVYGDEMPMFNPAIIKQSVHAA